jgi:hypothetical protein
LQGQGLSQQDTSQLSPENNRTSSIDADLADQIHLVGWVHWVNVSSPETKRSHHHIITSSHHHIINPSGPSRPSIITLPPRTLRINPTLWTRVRPNLHRARPWGRARLPPRQFTEEINLGDRHHPRLRDGRPLCLTTPPFETHPSHPPWLNFA